MASNGTETPTVDESGSDWYRKVWRAAEEALQDLDSCLGSLNEIHTSRLSAGRAINRTYMMRNPITEPREPPAPSDAIEMCERELAEAQRALAALESARARE